MIDHPASNDSKSYRPGTIFEESPLNASVVRGLRAKRLREVSGREASSLRAMQAAKRAQVVKPGAPPATVKTNPPIKTPTPVPVDGGAPKPTSK
jgi:hypothetical protein